MISCNVLSGNYICSPIADNGLKVMGTKPQSAGTKGIVTEM